MAEPVKKDDALAAAVREAFQRHMENARLASLAPRPNPLNLEAKRPTALATTASVRQLELKAEPAAEGVAPPAQAPESESATGKLAALADPARVATPAGEEVRLPSVDEAPLPLIDLDAALADFSMDEEVQLAAGKAEPVLASPPPPALALPQPANDRAIGAPAARIREKQSAPPPVPRRPDQPQSRVADQRAPDTLHASRPAIAPPVARQRAAVRRDAANMNQGIHFGTGSRREVQERSSSRWIILAVLAAASLLCIGIGGYVWISASAPAEKSGGVEGRAAPAQLPATKMAVAAVPAEPSKAVAALTSAALPAATTPAAPATEAATQESPIAARSVHTTTIKLDSIDLAVQDARERVGIGDIAAARLILARFHENPDPRITFAMAETYDPAIVRSPGLADAKQAQQLYEAAGRAGFALSAERLARLQVEKTN